jgi:hypothetical protein
MMSPSERGVDDWLADAYALTMAPVENVAITIMLDAIIESSVLTESGSIFGRCSAREVPSAIFAAKTASSESRQKPKGLIHNFSLKLNSKNRTLSTDNGASIPFLLLVFTC